MNFLWCLFKHPDACKMFFSPTTGVSWHVIIINGGTCLLYPRNNFFHVLCGRVIVWVVQSCTVLGGHVGSQPQGTTNSEPERGEISEFSVLCAPHEPCRGRRSELDVDQRWVLWQRSSSQSPPGLNLLQILSA